MLLFKIAVGLTFTVVTVFCYYCLQLTKDIENWLK